MNKIELEKIAEGLCSLGEFAREVEGNLRPDGRLELSFVQEMSGGSEKRNEVLSPEQVTSALRTTEARKCAEQKLRNETQKNREAARMIDKKWEDMYGMPRDILSEYIAEEFGVKIAIEAWTKEPKNPFTTSDGYDKKTVGIKNGRIYAHSTVVGSDTGLYGWTDD